MFKRMLLCSVAVMMLGVIGCGAQPGKSVVKYEKGDPNRVTEAPEDGTYALYSRMGANPDVSYSLRKGDKLGFEVEEGKVWAVAGNNRDELQVGMLGGYYWKLQEP